MAWSPAPTPPPTPIHEAAWFPTVPVAEPQEHVAAWWPRHVVELMATMQPATAALTGVHRQDGQLAAALRAAVFGGAGEHSQDGDLAVMLRSATMLGTNIVIGDLGAQLQPVRAAMTGQHAVSGSMGATMRSATASAAGQKIYTGAMAAELQAAVASLVGTQGIPGTIAAELRSALASANGGHSQTGSIAAALRQALFSGSAAHILSGSMAAQLRNALFAGAGTSKNLVVFDNAVDGGWDPGSATGGITYTYSHENYGNCIVVIHTNTTSSASVTCKYGGVTIPRVYGPTAGGIFIPYTSYCQVFALVSNGLPTGPNDVVIAGTSQAAAYASVTFKNAGSLSTSGDSASGNVSKSSAGAGEGRAAVAGYVGGANNFGTLTPNQVMNRPFNAFNTWGSVAGWGIDTGAGILFSSTHSGAKAGAVVTILPA